MIEPEKLPSQKTFAYKNTDTHTEQLLVVHWISRDTIAFTLTEKKDSCTVTEQGQAVNHFPGGDGESDTDENGDAYSASEYVVEKASSHLAIRISDDLDIAQIKNTPSENALCILTSSLPMHVKPE